MAFLPREVEYNRPHASVSPDTNSINVIVRPANGQTFSAGGDVIQFDLPARSFFSPSSLVLRGIITTTADQNFRLNSLSVVVALLVLVVLHRLLLMVFARFRSEILTPLLHRLVLRYLSAPCWLTVRISFRSV
mgnify:CR=1 FL=1